VKDMGFGFITIVGLLWNETASAVYIDNELGKGCQVWLPFLLLALKILNRVKVGSYKLSWKAK